MNMTIIVFITEKYTLMNVKSNHVWRTTWMIVCSKLSMLRIKIKDL